LAHQRRLFTRRERRVLYRRADGRCEQCGAAIGRDFHADHVYPFSKGGQTTLDNGQALCRPCNLKKTDMILRTPTLSPRDWQQRHLASCIARFTNTPPGGTVRHLSVVTPAGGKTYAGAMVAAELLNRRLIDRVVVLINAVTTIGAVDPGPVFNGWLGDLALCEVCAYRPDNDALSYGVREGREALVLTYAQVAAQPALLAKLVGKSRALVICDEPHHLAANAAWGVAVRDATALAPYMLLMTGTPVRTKGRMPWDDLYDATVLSANVTEYVVKPHFTLTYFEALNGPEQIVRPLEFIPFDAR